MKTLKIIIDDTQNELPSVFKQYCKLLHKQNIKLTDFFTSPDIHFSLVKLEKRDDEVDLIFAYKNPEAPNEVKGFIHKKQAVIPTLGLTFARNDLLAQLNEHGLIIEDLLNLNTALILTDKESYLLIERKKEK